MGGWDVPKAQGGWVGQSKCLHNHNYIIAWKKKKIVKTWSFFYQSLCIFSFWQGNVKKVNEQNGSGGLKISENEWVIKDFKYAYKACGWVKKVPKVCLHNILMVPKPN